MNGAERPAVDVFEAFPSAIVSNVWQISPYQRGSIVGTVWDSEKATGLDVVIDEGDSGAINTAPNAEPLESDTLMYVIPSQLPTTNIRALIAGYLLYNSEDEEYYSIVDAGVGKNQETGKIEHIELKIRQTEVG